MTANATPYNLRDQPSMFRAAASSSSSPAAAHAVPASSVSAPSIPPLPVGAGEYSNPFVLVFEFYR